MYTCNCKNIKIYSHSMEALTAIVDQVKEYFKDCKEEKLLFSKIVEKCNSTNPIILLESLFGDRDLDLDEYLYGGEASHGGWYEMFLYVDNYKAISAFPNWEDDEILKEIISNNDITKLNSYDIIYVSKNNEEYNDFIAKYYK